MHVHPGDPSYPKQPCWNWMPMTLRIELERTDFNCPRCGSGIGPPCDYNFAKGVLLPDRHRVIRGLRRE